MPRHLVGATGEPFTMRVEAGKIREFAGATRAATPSYLSDEPVAPPTFLVAAAFWIGPDSSVLGLMGIDLRRLLHGEQEFTFFGPPPRAGAVLTGCQRIDKVYEKQGQLGGQMSFAEVVTEFRDDEGMLVAETRATLIETSKPVTER